MATRPGIHDSEGGAWLGNWAPLTRVTRVARSETRMFCVGCLGWGWGGSVAKLWAAGPSPLGGFGERIRAALRDRRAHGQLAGAASGGDSEPRPGACLRVNVPSPTPPPPTGRHTPPPSLLGWRAHLLHSKRPERPPPPPDHPGPPRRTASVPPTPGSRPEGPGPPRPATPSAGPP